MSALAKFTWADWDHTCAKVAAYLEECDEMLQESDFNAVIELLPIEYRCFGLTGRDDEDGVNREAMLTLIRILPLVGFGDFIITAHTWKERPGTGLYPSLILFNDGQRILIGCAGNYVSVKYSKREENFHHYKAYKMNEFNLHSVACVEAVVESVAETFQC